ncbi:MAG TPA: YhjD/YihY/BrkB family envelope integrity protein [Mycobacterium sp.]|nr:MAG: inner membrane protein YhjD [Mycobacterium sp.]HOB50137.1 YhjD/YihY/BrkB family envelope integrity protein [Mycobacterium sp.]HPZ94555.1 YhjD/YihY/BrkB family envelope integrity protein [Mycobacterium sp.]HQE16094.1 YhjD/YihY/BrkB family envelope integrity protein [Mycobacterium sp.]
MRAQQRYSSAQGDFYAAGISYFTIFAIFPLLMVGFSVVGFVLASRPDLVAEIDGWVKRSVPGDFADDVGNLVDSAIASRTSVCVIGFATALWAGLGWMTNLRIALSEMWEKPTETDGFVKKKISDLGALVSVFLATLLALGLTAAANPAFKLAGPLRGVSLTLSVLVAWVMFTAIIAKLPRRPSPMRVAVRAGLLAAVVFEVFKQTASLYLGAVLHGPAGVTFGPVLGLLVFAYLTARLVLFATAWAATEQGPATEQAAATEQMPADSATGQP